MPGKRPRTAVGRKFDSCVGHVRRRGGARDPAAVCAAAMHRAHPGALARARRNPVLEGHAETGTFVDASGAHRDVGRRQRLPGGATRLRLVWTQGPDRWELTTQARGGLVVGQLRGVLELLDDRDGSPTVARTIHWQDGAGPQGLTPAAARALGARGLRDVLVYQAMRARAAELIGPPRPAARRNPSGPEAFRACVDGASNLFGDPAAACAASLARHNPALATAAPLLRVHAAGVELVDPGDVKTVGRRRLAAGYVLTVGRPVRGVAPVTFGRAWFGRRGGTWRRVGAGALGTLRGTHDRRARTMAFDDGAVARLHGPDAQVLRQLAAAYLKQPPR